MSTGGHFPRSVAGRTAAVVGGDFAPLLHTTAQGYMGRGSNSQSYHHVAGTSRSLCSARALDGIRCLFESLIPKGIITQ